MLENRITPTLLPGFASLSHPTSNPSLPTSWPTYAPPISSTLAPSSAAFAEWTRTAGPDNTIAIVGDSFSKFTGTDAGKDTEFEFCPRNSTTNTLAAGGTDFFNYFADNTFTNVVNGVLLAAAPDPFASGYAPAGYGSLQLDTTIRDNSFYQVKRYYNTSYSIVPSYIISTGTHLQYRSIDLTIIEGNEYPATSETEAAGLVGIASFGTSSSSILNTIIRKNEFDGLPSSATGALFELDGTPALSDNDWGKATPYDGTYQLSVALELPQRVVRLDWTSAPGGVYVPLRNTGTTTLYHTAVSDSSWLDVEIDAYALAEAGTVIYCEAEMTGLGAGHYSATVTVAGDGVARLFTVEVTVEATTSNVNYGPNNGQLPKLRRDTATTIQAVDFDRGGNSVGFYDPNNNDHKSGGLLLRPPGGDWYDYTVNVPADGWYRVEFRLQAAEFGEELRLDYGSTFATIELPSSLAWETLRPSNGGSGSGEFVYLSYGVQTVRLNVKSFGGPKIDWFRFIPVDSDTQAGLPLSYATAAPTISRAEMTTIQAEHYEKGGVNIAYDSG